MTAMLITVSLGDDQESLLHPCLVLSGKGQGLWCFVTFFSIARKLLVFLIFKGTSVGYNWSIADLSYLTLGHI